MGKIKASWVKEFYITTSLNDNHVYRAGSTVEGKVIIIVSEPKEITSPLRITLSGQAMQSSMGTAAVYIFSGYDF